MSVCMYGKHVLVYVSPKIQFVAVSAWQDVQQ